ncbi:MAG: AMP-binding protein, partial [Actinomycetota bacterium]
MSSLPDELRVVAGRLGDREALVDGDVRLTFHELADRSARLAGYIGGRARPGDRVAFAGPNSWQLVAAIFACADSRTVLV